MKSDDRQQQTGTSELRSSDRMRSAATIPDYLSKAVVFDFGGVIITPITNKLQVLADDHGTDLMTMLELLMGPRHESTGHPWHRSERGEIWAHEVQALLGPWADQAGVELTGNEIDQLMDGMTYSYVDSAIAKVAELAAGPHKLALLTNLNLDFRPTLEAEFDLSQFDAVIDSAVEGTRKPEPRIYELVEERLGVAGEQIIYLDDFDHNLGPAQARGWTTIHVTNPDRAIEELSARLVEHN